MNAWFHPLAAGSLALLFAASSAARAQSPGPSPSATASPSPTAFPSAAPSAAAIASPPAFPEQTGTDQASEVSAYHSADDLWAHIQELEQGPGSSSPSPQDIQQQMMRLIWSADVFQSAYPKDPRRWEAKLIALQYGSMLDSAQSKEPDSAKIESELKAVAAAPDAPKDVKAEARINLIGMHAEASGQDSLTPEIESEMLAFIHDFPDVPDVAQLQKMRVDSLQKSDPAKAAQLLDSLLKDSNPAVVEMAKAQVQIRDIEKKPLEMDFTAVDGSKVDLKKLRGKVVMIDFWATWCGPCMERMPDVVKLYNQLHGKGLEIVGISLDQDKSRLEAVTKSAGILWPQYFDGKGWQNEISSRYGIAEIPCMWLVDKKGMVVDTDPEDALEEKIEKLLAQ